MTKHYANPFRDVAGLVPERQDMGVDYSGSGPVYAIGLSVVVNINPHFYHTHSGAPEPLVGFRFLHGPAAGRCWYAAECIMPVRVKPGDVVDRHTVIGTLSHACGTGTEWGWCQQSGLDPLAALSQFGGYREGQRTALGDNFGKFLAVFDPRLRGLAEGRPISGTLPPGWPKTWKFEHF